MSSDGRIVLVTGATGQQGGAVARALLAAGWSVRALTRKPEGSQARRLAKAGATVIPGSFDEPETVRRAAAGAEAMFLMGNYFEAGAEGETRQGIAAADIARAAGVGHLVYSSVADADKATGIPHFESKYLVEQHIASLGIGYTIVAPVWFMDNLTAPWAIGGLQNGAVSLALPADRRNQMIAVDDIGAFVAAVLARGASTLGRRFDIAGDELPGTQLTEILQRVLGRPMRYEAVPNAVLSQFSPEAAIMFDWIDRVGYDADIAGLGAAFPEVAWTRFEDWARRVAAPALAGAGQAEAVA